jgi:hypothetical protein
MTSVYEEAWLAIPACRPYMRFHTERVDLIQGCSIAEGVFGGDTIQSVARLPMSAL